MKLILVILGLMSICFFFKISYSFVDHFDNSESCFKVYVSNFGRDVHIYKFEENLHHVSFENKDLSSSYLIYLKIKRNIVSKKKVTRLEDLVLIFQNH